MIRDYEHPTVRLPESVANGANLNPTNEDAIETVRKGRRFSRREELKGHGKRVAAIFAGTTYHSCCLKNAGQDITAAVVYTDFCAVHVFEGGRGYVDPNLCSPSPRPGKVWKYIGGDQEEVLSAEKFGGYKTEVKEMIEGKGKR